MNTGNLPLFGLMLLAGFGIPVMAAVNAGLATRTGSTTGAVTILTGVAFAVSLLAFLAKGRVSPSTMLSAPPGFYLAGTLFLFYITSITFCAPRIGLANAVFLVLFGQIVASTSIDHFGWFGTEVMRLTSKRSAGILLMAVGVYLARKDLLLPANQIIT